ncbi:MAG: hypothetical protein Q4F83_12255 [Eubacteriales bacterium]|nr:hypothetical protein [Eubacteriales bacterium]
MDENYQEVYFDKYCKTCKHEKMEEKFDPCNECLSEPVNAGSHVPVNWEDQGK